MSSHPIHLQGANEYMTNITGKSAETDLVLMVDAFDVWFQTSPSVLIERFNELGTSGVVASAEMNCCCWPGGSRHVSSWDDMMLLCC